ncbi:uridine kinase family protein [Porcipelethomonas sp.]|uniref:uridine kinase family protein n=1 Tax=Porcipelethomonas sp. TaxID=2981675 RepID=UPI003EF46295
MKYIKTDLLNKIITENPEKLVMDSESNYYNQLDNLCNNISQKRDTHPVILISGPSGSGKTSTANEVSRILAKNYECDSKVISLDNYFRSNNSPDMPRDKNGNIDLESPFCTDLKLLQEHIMLLKKCEEFMMPIFDFKTQTRSGYVPFKREADSIVIMEGIHALNPMVTGENNFATCVYISVRTRLKSCENKILHPRLIRLMRRLCRDSLFRGRDLQSIFSYFESVSEGEEKYILPFKHRADFQIDTFMSYEVPVYKSFLYSKLIEAEQILSSNSYYNNIVDFFNLLLPVSEKNVPESSLIREFIG